MLSIDQVRTILFPELTPPQVLARRVSAQLRRDDPTTTHHAALRPLRSLDEGDFEAAAASLSELASRRLRKLPDRLVPPSLRSTRDRLRDRYSKVNGIELEVDPEFRAKATELIRKVLRGNPVVARRIARSNSRLVIYPKAEGLNLYDMPEMPFARWQEAFHGNALGQHFGILGSSTAMAPTPSNSRDSHTVVHELAHLVHARGLSQMQKVQIEELYAEALEDPYPWYRDYWSTNMHEYFAELSAAYLGHGCWTGTHEDIRTHQPEAYALLEDIYGPPPASAEPEHTGRAVVTSEPLPV